MILKSVSCGQESFIFLTGPISLLIKVLANINLEWGRKTQILCIFGIQCGYCKLDLEHKTARGKLDKFMNPRGLTKQRRKRVLCRELQAEINCGRCHIPHSLLLVSSGV